MEDTFTNGSHHYTDEWFQTNKVPFDSKRSWMHILIGKFELNPLFTPMFGHGT